MKIVIVVRLQPGCIQVIVIGDNMLSTVSNMAARLEGTCHSPLIITSDNPTARAIKDVLGVCDIINKS